MPRFSTMHSLICYSKKSLFPRKIEKKRKMTNLELDKETRVHIILLTKQCESYDEGKTGPKIQRFQLPEQLHRVSSVAIQWRANSRLCLFFSSHRVLRSCTISVVNWKYLGRARARKPNVSQVIPTINAAGVPSREILVFHTECAAKSLSRSRNS